MNDGNTYKTGQLGEILHASRDMLRYYEEQGIIKPKQNKDNSYREYDFFDIFTLMVTDFYKKRNLSIKEIKKLQAGSQIDELAGLLEQKAWEIEESISAQERMLRKIKDTRAFCNDIKKHLDCYCLKEFPVFEIKGELSEFDAVGEYPVILDNVDLLKEDILSNIIKKLTFDENGFIDTRMYVVERKDSREKEEGKSFLDYTSCIYTIVEDGRNQAGQTDPKVKAFESGVRWAAENGYDLLGEAFLITRLVTYIDNKERMFIEVYVPVIEK